MQGKPSLPFSGKEVLIGAALLSGLYLSNLYGFLLFHSLAEMFGIAVAFGIFAVTWNTRRFSANNYLLFLGISYLFVAAAQFLHMLSFENAGVFSGYGANLSIQLLLAARYIESSSFLLAPLFIGRRLRVSDVMAGYGIATTVLLSLIFLGYFPDCYIEGVGLTPFKKNAEYLISFFFASSFVLLYRKRRDFDRDVFRLIGLSIPLAIAAEAAMTLYVNVFGLYNLMGHFFKIVSFYLIYKAIIEASLVRPYGVMFRGLQANAESLRSLLDETWKRTREVSALLEGARSILEHAEFSHSAKAIFDQCKGLTGATAGYVALLSEDGRENEVVFLDSGGLPCNVNPSLPMPIRGLRAEAYRSGKAVFENDFANSKWKAFMPEGHASLQNVLFAPLIDDGRTVGLLGVANKPGGFDEDDARMAAAFGELAAIALFNARTLEHLENSRERFRSVAQTATDAIITSDPNGKIIYWNRAAEAMFGYPVEEAVGKPLTIILPERFREVHTRGLGRAVSTGEFGLTGKTIELVGLGKAGVEFPIELSLAKWETKEGMFFTGIIRDISERKKAEEELRKYREGLEAMVAERTLELINAKEALEVEIAGHREAKAALAFEKERLSVTLRSIGDGVITADTEENVVLLNKAAEHLTGWTQEEAAGKPLSEVMNVIDEKTRMPVESPVKKVLSSRGIAVDSENTIISKCGSERLIAESGAPITDADSRVIGAVIVFRDVTEKRMIEEELLKANKLESMGILAGGIAHDFNNALTSILTNVSVARMKAVPGGEVFGLLSGAEKAAFRAKSLTQQLLTFSMGGTPVKKTAPVGDLIKESADFAVTGSDITCGYGIQKELWPVDVDPGQFCQVIENLAINAAQAVPEDAEPERKHIIICAENVSLEKGAVPSLGEGRYVKVSVADRGAGIPKENLSKIFDPYFTTKAAGSGLGLATTYSIIKKHKGYVSVQSQVGLGTTFIIYLPASAAGAPHKRKAERSVAGASGGRVLVMDDEPDIRESVGAALAIFGYKTTFANDGVEAIEAYKKAKAVGIPFDAVILDLTVPGGMGGRETIEQLKTIDPEVKAIVSSGYSNDPIMAEYGKYGFCGVVVKPYRIEDLVGVIRSAAGRK